MIGINTGKIVIGSAYMGKKRQMTWDEEQMQSVLLAEMPSNALNRAAIVSLSPSAYQHIGQAEKTQHNPFKRFRAFLAKVVGRAI
jgi:hypothetical protein